MDLYDLKKLCAAGENFFKVELILIFKGFEQKGPRLNFSAPSWSPVPRIPSLGALAPLTSGFLDRNPLSPPCGWLNPPTLTANQILGILIKMIHIIIMFVNHVLLWWMWNSTIPCLTHEILHASSLLCEKMEKMWRRIIRWQLPPYCCLWSLILPVYLRLEEEVTQLNDKTKAQKKHIFDSNAKYTTDTEKLKKKFTDLQAELAVKTEEVCYPLYSLHYVYILVRNTNIHPSTSNYKGIKLHQYHYNNATKAPLINSHANGGAVKCGCVKVATVYGLMSSPTKCKLLSTTGKH